EPALVENVRWLAGYRHPRFGQAPIAAELLTVFADRRPLLDGVERVGQPLVVLPVLFHLLWQDQLRTDLSRPLAETSPVWSAE
ncbi:MAG TPA: transposase, partial [Jatrophihabitans sp.]|nr:transposase [Jatrophihabitans sp.]